MSVGSLVVCSEEILASLSMGLGDKVREGLKMQWLLPVNLGQKTQNLCPVFHLTPTSLVTSAGEEVRGMRPSEML